MNAQIPYIAATRRESGVRVLLLLAEVRPDILRVRVVVAMSSTRPRADR